MPAGQKARLGALSRVSKQNPASHTLLLSPLPLQKHHSMTPFCSNASVTVALLFPARRKPAGCWLGISAACRKRWARRRGCRAVLPRRGETG